MIGQLVWVGKRLEEAAVGGSPFLHRARAYDHHSWHNIE